MAGDIPNFWEMEQKAREANYKQGWDDAMAQKPPCACGGGKLLAKLGHLDLVYDPEDERHWLDVGLLLERGVEDINDCTVIILEEVT